MIEKLKSVLEKRDIGYVRFRRLCKVLVTYTSSQVCKLIHVRNIANYVDRKTSSCM